MAFSKESSLTLIELLIVTPIRKVLRVFLRGKSAMSIGRQASSSFTLIELLIVIGVLAVLATVAVLALNPTELMKQARDSNRLADLNTLNKALSVYQSSGQTSLGTANTVYVSIPKNVAADCSDLGLPALPATWSYACAPSSTLRNINGAGWIPLSFSSVSYGTPLEKLPVDPINTTSTGQYYTYVMGGSWKLATRLESAKYTAQAGKDGGPDPAIYEEGTDLNLAPFIGGIVNLWEFDETGTTAFDSSGFGSSGTMYSSSTVSDLHTGAGCRSGSCVGFDGVDDWINITDQSYGKDDVFTMVVSFNIDADANDEEKQFLGGAQTASFLGKTLYYPNNLKHYHQDGVQSEVFSWATPVNLKDGKWHQAALSFNGPANQITAYFDGSLLGSNSASDWGYTGNGTLQKIGCGYTGGASTWMEGLIDTIYIYKRNLSSAEVRAVYNSGQ